MGLKVSCYCFVATSKLDVVGDSSYLSFLFLSILRLFEILMQLLLIYLLDRAGASLELFGSCHKSQHIFAMICEY